MTWTVKNKREPSSFVKIEPKHRQVISSKFTKSFRGARDLVVFYDFCSDFSGFFSTLQNSSSTTKSPATLKLFGILFGIT